MTADAAKIARHEAAFVEPMRHAEKRADWHLDRLRKGKGGNLVKRIAAFERAAEEHQLAVHREHVARRHWSIPTK